MESLTQLSTAPTATRDFALAAVLDHRGDNDHLHADHLPLELLRSIIQEVQSQHPYQYRMLFTIRSVCSLWMKFIDSSSEFWCSISSNHKSNLILMILQNSSSQPLSVKYIHDGTNREEITDFFQLVVPTVLRWKSLEYSTYSFEFDERIISLPFQNLEKLIVHLYGSPVHYTGCLNAAKLRYIAFNSFTLDWRILSGLRTLKLSNLNDGISVSQLHFLLKTSPSLESLEIGGGALWTTIPGPSDLPYTPTLLPKLQRIRISLSHPAPFDQLLDLIDCPNLRHFSASALFIFNPKNVFESVGRIVGGHRGSGWDDFTQLLIFDSISGFEIRVGNRRIFFWEDFSWHRERRQQDCQNGLSAVLRGFDGRIIEGIREIILHGMSYQYMTGLCPILHCNCPNVMKLQVELSLRGVRSDGYRLLEWLGSPLSLEDGGGWLFPKLTTLHIDASEGLICDGILRTVEGRRPGATEAIREVEIQNGKVGRDTVEKLKTYLQDFRMVGTEVF